MRSPTGASCSVSGSATGRRRTTRSGCPRSACACSSRSSTSCERLLEGEAVTAEGHGFRLDEQQLALRPDAGSAAADLAGREQRQRRPAGRAARRRLARSTRTRSSTSSSASSASTTPSASAAACRPRGEIPIIKELYVGEDDESAMRAVRPYLEDKYKAYVPGGRARCCPRATRSGRRSSSSRRAGASSSAGPRRAPARCASTSARLGATSFLFRFQWPGMPQELVLASMRRAAESVFPLVAGR